jgi:glycine/D-amino acid oxidase-like deaminating enzyme
MSQLFDVSIVGGGLAGLATALTLQEVAPELQVALVGPGGRFGAIDFASGQPAIATHPHFSLDHNFLSQWTCFALPIAETKLTLATKINSAVQLARGRWQIAQSKTDAQRLKALLDVFNQKVNASLAVSWVPEKTQFGAIFLPGAWAVNPQVLQQVWLSQLTVTRPENKPALNFVDDSVTDLYQDSHHIIHVKTLLGQTVRSKVSVIAHAGLLQSLFRYHGNVSAEAAMPLTRWPGKSEYDSNRLQCDARKTQFGRAIVQGTSYALPLEGDDWLINSEAWEYSTQQFAGDRWHASDRLPYVGTMWDVERTIHEKVALSKYPSRPLPKCSNIFVNTAHGSRGLLGALAGAEVSAALVSDLLLGTNSFVKLELNASLCAAINPDRYIKRLLRNLQ